MIKALLKKQLLELNQTLFINRKTGKAKSTASVAGSIALFAILMIVVLGGMFTSLALSLSSLLYVDMAWLYFLIIGMIAIALGIFGSVFNTYASLYLAKDNDLLLSLPIPVHKILLVRLLGVYLMGAFYSLIVYLPGVFVYLFVAPQNVATVFSVFWSTVLITFFILILSCILGWVVAKVSKKLKNKSFITVIISIVLIAAYYFVYFKANTMISSFLEHAQETGDTIRGKIYLLYLIGQAAAGHLLPLLVITVLIAILFFVTIALMSKSFLKLSVIENISKTVYKDKKVKTKRLGTALLGREFSRLFSSANYMLNCGMGTLFLVVAAIAMIFNVRVIRNVCFVQMEFSTDLIAAMAIGAICIIMTMNDLSTPSVSLEGKHIWLIQSLPVSPWEVLQSKLKLHIILTDIPAVLCVAVAWIVVRPSLIFGILMLIIPLMFGILCACAGLALNLKNPNLKWSSETAVVKQGVNIFVMMFGGWVVLLALAGLYILLTRFIGDIIFLVICLAVMTTATVALMKWLKCRGAQIFAQL